MLIRRLRYWMASARRSAALREEMELHLAEKAAELEADGVTAEHARAEARRRFGNVVLKHEQSREIWMTRSASELGQDVRYGVRMMVKKPMVTIVAGLLLQPLPRHCLRTDIRSSFPVTRLLWVRLDEASRARLRVGTSVL